eukprot:s460_g1.t1
MICWRQSHPAEATLLLPPVQQAPAAFLRCCHHRRARHAAPGDRESYATSVALREENSRTAGPDFQDFGTWLVSMPDLDQPDDAESNVVSIDVAAKERRRVSLDVPDEREEDELRPTDEGH